MTQAHTTSWPRSITLVAILVVLLLPACKHTTAPVIKQENRPPTLQSISAFPGALNPGDSTIVVCQALDPDADTLVYDWFSDARLVIEGNTPSDHDLYDTARNSHVFYYGQVSSVDTTAWVQCIVRDHKGGSAGGIVHLVLNH